MARLVFATALAVTCAGALGQGDASRELLERIVQCRASIPEVAKFNSLIDQSKIPFTQAPDIDVLGGNAWNLDHPIVFGGVSSDVVIMTSRASAYIRVASDEPRASAMKVAMELTLFNTLDQKDTLWFQRNFGSGIASVFTSEDKISYWVGCEYNNIDLIRQIHKDHATSAEGIAKKRAAKNALRQRSW